MPAKKDNKDTAILAGYSPPLLRPRGKARWIFFVLLNFILFALCCVLWQLLGSRTGEFFWEFPLHSHLIFEIRQLSPVSDRLSVITNPWMPVILSLLLSAMIVVPVTISVMYQLLLAMVFVATVALLGMSPEIAVILTISCLLSARSRLRRQYPFYAVLFGLIPITIYLAVVYLLNRARFELLPFHQWILLVPYVMTILLAAIAAFFMVLMARLTRFRPGAVWPIALLFFAVAAGLFYNYVGFDELMYSQIHATATAEIPKTGAKRRQAFHARLEDRCGYFLEHYGSSKRAPAVAWIRAWLESVHFGEYDGNRGNLNDCYEWPVIELISLFGKRATGKSGNDKYEGALRKLVADYGDSDPAGLAKARLGLVELNRALAADGESRRIRLNRAGDILREAEAHLEKTVLSWPGDKDRGNKGIFVPVPTIPATRGIYSQSLAGLRKLNWLIRENGIIGDPLATRVLERWVDINHAGDNYLDDLEQLKDAAETRKSKLGANITIAWAEHLDLPSRTKVLMKVASEETKDMDAAIEANYKLGIIAVRESEKPWLTSVLGEKNAVDFFKKVKAAPHNPWQQSALEELTRLEAPAASESSGAKK